MRGLENVWETTDDCRDVHFQALRPTLDDIWCHLEKFLQPKGIRESSTTVPGRTIRISLKNRA